MKHRVKDIPHYIGHRHRLREKLRSSKRGTLQDYEILEVLLFSAVQRIDVKPIAKKLIKHFGSLAGLLQAIVDEIANISGINDNITAAIMCAQEIIERTLKHKVQPQSMLSNWKELIEYLRYSVGCNTIEQLRTLYFNKRCNIIKETLQEGTIDQTPIYIREIIKQALLIGATAIVISHNHPSGNTRPSKADVVNTTKLVDACKSVNITLIDHIIISKVSYFSFKTEGLL